MSMNACQAECSFRLIVDALLHLLLCCCFPLQTEASITSLFFADSYFDENVSSPGWLLEQQAQLRLWITLFTRRVLLLDESGRRSASPVPGALFAPTPTQDGDVEFSNDGHHTRAPSVATGRIQKSAHRAAALSRLIKSKSHVSKIPIHG